MDTGEILLDRAVMSVFRSNQRASNVDAKLYRTRYCGDQRRHVMGRCAVEARFMGAGITIEAVVSGSAPRV